MGHRAFGVVGPAEPGEIGRALGIREIFQRPEHPVVPRHAADILGRAGACSGKTDGTSLALRARAGAFEDYFVHPLVAEVVGLPGSITRI
jgi:hypothetical protein